MNIIQGLRRTIKKHPGFLATLLIWLLFAQAVTSIAHLSVTFDEPVHITTGYSILRTGDFRLVEDHPPLLEMWMSWPLLLSPKIPVPAEIPTWALGDRRLFAHHDAWWNLPIDTWLTPARITITFLGVLLAALLYRWATDWFGPQGGFLALALCVFDPNILAHTRLATLDLGVTLLIIANLYMLQRALKHPDPIKLSVAGILLGCALGAKISSVILLPITGVQLLIWGGSHWKTKATISYGIVYFGTALSTLWAIHLFQIGPLDGLPINLPAPTYLRALLRIGEHITVEGRRAFLLGQTYRGGHWAYFPVAFLLKTPVPTMLLLGGSLTHILFKMTKIRFMHRGVWYDHKAWRALYLAPFPFLYLLISIFGEINIGYRHILPILPFIYLAVAYWGSQIDKKGRSVFKNVLILVMILWQITSTLGIWPFHLTYFNEVVGGPKRGYRYLADSNVDWGQGLKAVKNYLDKHTLKDAQLSHFTYFLDPARVYGIDAIPLPPATQAPAILPQRYNPAPGTYILSASSLRGLQGADSEMYNWFWHRDPDDIIANAMLVYQVAIPTPDPTWIAQCSIPVTPLSKQAIDAGFGQKNWRLLNFDCTQGWIYPKAGKSSGWYVISAPLLASASTDNFLNRQLRTVHVSYQQQRATHLPPHTIYASQPLSLSVQQAVYPAAAQTPPNIQTTQRVTSPLTLANTASFLRSRAYMKANELEIETWWQIHHTPITRPLSIMAHLLTPSGEVLGVADGLGSAPTLWQTEDVIVQRHLFTIPIDISQNVYLLRTGIYWLDTSTRWSITGYPKADAIFVPIHANNVSPQK